jgi:hypothetical protein
VTVTVEEPDGGNYAGTHERESAFMGADWGNGRFQVAGDRLYFIKTRNTGTGLIEVHSASAGINYDQDVRHSASFLSEVDADNGWFQIAGEDLYFIKTRNAHSGSIEVHLATHDSNYEQIWHYVTTIYGDIGPGVCQIDN